ncbi:adenosylcobinamide-GDP ribazoletransferase [Aquisalimonas sp. APHAB1-3]|uniref:adenosylcobinamide-GDP ribazoletransferase n=1 Tax=Aquisalimonas sp. APHAB1-3 TaxID=3402080 RepID=UPI003AB013B9
MIRGLLLATVFLTRIPVRLPEALDERDQGVAVAAYPLVGLALGVGLAVLAWLLGVAGMPPLPAAVVVVAALAGVTGALHLDGLADSADAWLGGHGDRERMLTIMKDPACGPAGVVAVVLVLLAKVAAVAALLDAPGGWAALVLAPMLARGGCALLFPLLPYVRAGGLGEAGARHLAGPQLTVMLAAGVVVSLVLAGWAGLGMVLTAVAVLWLGVWLMRRLLGGFTGDTAGALLEMTEAAVLLVASAMVIGA